MAQLENIEAIEARLWRAVDLLWSGSELASNEYFMPIMGLIFLRPAWPSSRKSKSLCPPATA